MIEFGNALRSNRKLTKNGAQGVSNRYSSIDMGQAGMVDMKEQNELTHNEMSEFVSKYQLTKDVIIGHD